MQKKKQIGKIVKGIVTFPLAAILCCGTIVYAVSDNHMDSVSEAVVSHNDTAEEKGVAGQVSANGCEAAEPSEEMKEYASKLPQEIVVVLDPGHGGVDEGCSKNGVPEKDINLEIANAVRDRLHEMGYQVVVTRDGDQTRTTEERVQQANALDADLYVSIHQSACELAEPEGVEVWYCDNRAENERLARLMQKYVVQFTGAAAREIGETDSLYVIREANMPSCLVETGFLTNAAERKKLTDSEYQAAIAEGIANGIDLFFYPKTMYLTFDDGPSEENTNAILDILKERNIKATFFVVGENAEKHPEVARRIVAEGHTIGIHCNHHDYDEIYADADSYIADFEEAYRIVYETTGVEAKLFRFPGGSINAYNEEVCEEIIEKMTERGFVYFDWNASLEDAVTQSPDPQSLIENATASTLKRRRVVMLAHDIVYATTLCMDDLIDALPEYRMEPLTADTTPIQF